MCVPVIKDEDRFSMADIFVWGEPREPERVTTEDLPGDRTPLLQLRSCRTQDYLVKGLYYQSVHSRVLQAHRVTEKKMYLQQHGC